MPMRLSGRRLRSNSLHTRKYAVSSSQYLNRRINHEEDRRTTKHHTGKVSGMRLCTSTLPEILKDRLTLKVKTFYIKYRTDIDVVEEYSEYGKLLGVPKTIEEYQTEQLSNTYWGILEEREGGFK